ncbi:hypothetical protein Tco_0162167 [Tanacetum coccineum]
MSAKKQTRKLCPPADISGEKRNWEGSWRAMGQIDRYRKSVYVLHLKLLKLRYTRSTPHLLCDPQVAFKDTWIFDSACSGHMIGNKSYLTDYQDYDGGFVAFADSSKRGRITGKVTYSNTLDHLGKFDGKSDEEFLVGYSINSKAFRVFNSRTMKEIVTNGMRVLETYSDCSLAGIIIVPDHEYIPITIAAYKFHDPSNFGARMTVSPKDDC